MRIRILTQAELRGVEHGVGALSAFAQNGHPDCVAALKGLIHLRDRAREAEYMYRCSPDFALDQEDF